MGKHGKKAVLLPAIQHLISIRNCNIGLAALCIAISAAVCTVLATGSGNRAVDKVKGAGKDGIELCFKTGESNAEELTKLIFRQVGARVRYYAEELTGRPRRTVNELTHFLAGQHPNKTLHWPWLQEVLQPILWAKHWELARYGMTNLGLITAKGQLFLYQHPQDTRFMEWDEFSIRKEYTTLPDPATHHYNHFVDYHELLLITLNGSDYGPPCPSAKGRCRAWWSVAMPFTGDFRRPVTNWTGLPGRRLEGYEPCEISAGRRPVGPLGTYAFHHGGIPRSPCPYSGRIDPFTAYSFWKYGIELAPPTGPNNVSEPRTTPLVKVGGTRYHIIASAYTHPDADPALLAKGSGKLGVVYSGIEQIEMSVFLQRIRVGTSKMRVFVTQASDWEQRARGTIGEESLNRGRGKLAGVSHGSAKGFEPIVNKATGRVSWWGKALADVEATDSVIRGVALHVARLAQEQGVTGYDTCCRDHGLASQLGSADCPEEPNGYHDDYAPGLRPCSPKAQSEELDGYELISRDPKGYVELEIKTSMCLDDPVGKLIPLSLDCPIMQWLCNSSTQRGNPAYCCDFDMSRGPAWYRDNPEEANNRITSRRKWLYTNGTTIADLCPQSCDTCPPAQPEERWFASAERFDDGYGLDWWMVFAVDRAFIFADIDASIDSTNGMIQQNNKEVDDARADDLLTLALAVGGLGIALMIFSVAFAYGIVRPINKLAEQMKHVAQMELEKVDTKEDLSKLWEVMRMQKDFRKMVFCIKKYREFLPMSVLEEVSGGREDEAAAAAADAAEAAAAAADAAEDASRASSVSQRRSASRQRSSKQASSHSSMGMTCAAQVNKALKSGVTKKKMSFLAAGFKGWHQHFHKQSDHDMLTAHTALLRAMLEVVSKNKGVPDVFSGDRLLVSFNAVKAVATHKVASCHTALALVELSDKCRASGYEALLGEAAKKGKGGGAGVPEVSIGVASGDAKVGNMGCEGMKKYSFMSVVLTFTWALERHNNTLGAGCLIDKTVAVDVENNFTLRELGAVLLEKRNKKPCVVHQLVGKKEASEDEWMYQLEEQNNAVNEFSHWKAAFKAVAEQQWEEAGVKLEALQPAGAVPAAGDFAAERRARAVAVLRRCVDAKAPLDAAVANWH